MNEQRGPWMNLQTTMPHRLIPAVILLSTLLSGCSSMKQSSIAMQRQSVEYERLTLVAIQRLKQTIVTQNAQLAEQEAEAHRLDRRTTYLTAMTEDAWTKNCDIEALARVEMPRIRTTETVDRYLTEILSISAKQESYSQKDTQVFLLAEVGEEYLHLLLEHLEKYDESAQRVHLYHAVQKLANDHTKAEILARFAHYSHDRDVWVDFVRQMSWEADAKELLIEHLERPEVNYGSSWQTVPVIAKLNDSSTYPCLIEKFKRFGSVYTYETLSKLPGIENLLIEAIPYAWESAYQGDRSSDRVGMAAVALSIGDPQALDIVIEQLDHNDFWLQQYDFRYTILKHIDFSGSNDEIREWVHSNRENLRFDAKRQRFYAAKPNNDEGAKP